MAAGAVAAVVLACLIALALHRGEPQSDAVVLASASAPSGATAGRLAVERTAVPLANLPSGPSSEPSPAPAVLPLGSHELPKFEVDSQGRLIKNTHTRDELERLSALNDSADALALLRQLETTLPPIAYRQATDAYYAYRNYSIALAQAFPPGQSPVTDENAALRQLDALHALRVQQFGEDTAQAYFGEEELTARRLLADMQAQPAGAGSSFGQRAEQAQRQAPVAPR